MTITLAIQRQLFGRNQTQVIRIGQRRHARSHTSNAAASHVSERFAIGIWTTEEHELFLEGLDLHPSGPWKLIARHVGSRTPRQIMAHAQKYRMRIRRRARGEAAGVSPSAPALTSTTEISEPCSGANANETASSVAEPQPAEVLAVASLTPVAEAETAEMTATNGETQGDLQSVHSHLVRMAHGDEADLIDVASSAVVSPPASLDCDFLAMVVADPMFDDMELFVSDDDSEPLQFYR
ncbi:hypothetical protein BBJ28_00011047 [Nothophytophthora sp. Chile5]|nr:hypothetical protein BBJ28_00011047 [Nothophytophthora sp. Chile5]